MLKKVRVLGQWGRSAENEHEAAGAWSKRRSLLGNGEAAGVGRCERRQVFNGRQRYPYGGAGCQQNLKVSADRAGKSVTVEIIQGRSMILPVVRF